MNKNILNLLEGIWAAEAFNAMSETPVQVPASSQSILDKLGTDADAYLNARLYDNVTIKASCQKMALRCFDNEQAEVNKAKLHDFIAKRLQHHQTILSELDTYVLDAS
ncbi:hypothetical protein HR060_01115 [Catenovulum sp. SM1970]|uniref:hypothetical protein n=1 Tax=Marinifaba aquimaris TaxID=2741323 RepID=UPI001571FA04|nr:hypothetical protein [Marinifaba aquimaris]NTS75451.1 hypothetical protein [Marinifaba aquimaris]